LIAHNFRLRLLLPKGKDYLIASLVFFTQKSEES
jgi:hypothetical protein